MKKKYFILILILCLSIPFINSKALTINRGKGESATNLVKKILGDDIEFKNAKKRGTIYTFNGGSNYFGINSGIILDTSGVDNEEKGYVDKSLQDLLGKTNTLVVSSYNSLKPHEKQQVGEREDLEALYNENDGGHTSSLEFELIADGNLLNFNYAFASTEFDQEPKYNDTFGLFVSINNGEYENIATIKRDDNTLAPVSITTLRAGLNGKEMLNGLSTDLEKNTNHTLFKINDTDNDYIDYNGISNVFNASKKVNVGDKVKVKLVIADASDDGYDSYVFIEADSLSFNGIKNPNTSDNIYLYITITVISLIGIGLIIVGLMKNKVRV